MLYPLFVEVAAKRVVRKKPSIEDDDNDRIEGQPKSKKRKLPKPDFKNYVQLETGGETYFIVIFSMISCGWYY